MTSAPPAPPIEIGLNAAIVAVAEQQPLILVVTGDAGERQPDNLPFGPFDPARPPHVRGRASGHGSPNRPP